MTNNTDFIELVREVTEVTNSKNKNNRQQQQQTLGGGGILFCELMQYIILNIQFSTKKL